MLEYETWFLSPYLGSESGGFIIDNSGIMDFSRLVATGTKLKTETIARLLKMEATDMMGLGKQKGKHVLEIARACFYDEAAWDKSIASFVRPDLEKGLRG
jgi:hypothetical protein